MKAFAKIIVTTSMVAGGALAQTMNFDNLKTGVLPPGWTGTKTGSGEAKENGRA